MPGSLGRAAGRLLRWWRWYRVVLFGAFAVGLVVALALDHAIASPLVGMVALAPLAVLISLSGSRIADHHHRIAALKRGGVAEAEVAALRRELPLMVSGAAIGQAVMVIVVIQPRDPRAVDLVAQVVELLPSTPVYALDRSGDGEIAARTGDLLGPGCQLRLVSSSNARSVMTDVAELVEAADARHVLVLDRTVRAGHADDVARLVASISGADEPWVGATVLGHRSDMVVLRRSAFVELGGFGDAFSLHEDLQDQLTAAGYVIDRVESTGAVGALAITDGELVDLRRGGPHQLARGVAWVPHRGPDIDDLAGAAREMTLDGIAAGLMFSDGDWERHRFAAYRWPVPSYRRAPAGAWLAELGAVVTTNDWSPEMRDLVETARRYGVPTIGRMLGVHDVDDLRTGRDRSVFRTVDTVLCQGAADAAVVDGFGGSSLVVGNAMLESLWRRPAVSADAPTVVVHANFAAGQREDEDAFLQSALAACRSLDLPVVVTGRVHGDSAEVDERPIGPVLSGASVLIARFGAAPFDAMARGVPFVYHDPHGEAMPLFADPMGAFDTTRSENDLRAAVTDAMSWRAMARDRSEVFFRHHVDITEIPSDRRIAHAVAGIVRSTG